MPKKLILIIGAPGAGKTTDSKLIAKRHDGNIAAFSIGDILREEVKNNTAIGKIAEKYMQKGELVPGEVIMYEIFGKIKKAPTNIVLVDGLPRGLNQMKALGDTLHNDKEVKLVAVIEIRVKEETARKRVLGDNPTQEEIELFENKMKIYNDLIAEIENHYKKLDLLTIIDGEDQPEKVVENIDNFLKRKITKYNTPEKR
jgi:adenylate kinase